MVNVRTEQETREMFNLTVDTAHTFYVGNNGWLVHNCEGLKAGQIVEDVSPLGKTLAEDSDDMFRSLRSFKRYTTIATTEVDGIKYITVNGGSMKNKNLISELKEISSTKGYEFLDNDQGSMHAEEFLYRHFKGNMNSIGISHVGGPCKGSCRPFFSDKNVELVWTGIWK